jgi:hypothetical protein
MKKFIIYELKISNCNETTMMGILCLYALLKCLPSERVTVSKSGILPIIFTQSLSLNNTKIAVHALNISKLLLSVLSGSELRQTVSFIEAAVYQFNN